MLALALSITFNFGIGAGNSVARALQDSHNVNDCGEPLAGRQPERKGQN